jgi:hypothetical protein
VPTIPEVNRSVQTDLSVPDRLLNALQVEPVSVWNMFPSITQTVDSSLKPPAQLVWVGADEMLGKFQVTCLRVATVGDVLVGARLVAAGAG